MSSGFKKFLALWTGELISSIGGGLTSFGLGVYVFQKTGSAAGMALVTLLGFLPTLLLSVPAGVLADRYDRRLLKSLSMCRPLLSASVSAFLPSIMPSDNSSEADLRSGFDVSFLI